MIRPAALIASLLLAGLAVVPATAQTAPAGSPPAAAPSAAAGPQLNCVDPFGADASHASIVKIVGKEFAVFQKVDGPEGTELDATVLYPNNEARRLELHWVDEKKRKGLAHVTLSGTSVWVAPNGLRMGMTLAEVEKINGKPFLLSGFDWDYGGYVTDWKGGTLGAPIKGGCIVQVRFTVPEDAPEAAASKVSGDRTFPSTDKNIRAVKPVIGTLSFGFPQP